MTTFELSMHIDHYRNWGIKEGVREIFTNAVDSERDGHEMTFRYDPARRQIKIHSEGAVLERSSLLIGKSDKAGRGDQVGQFGEGYKCGALALLRCGKNVSIFNRNANEKWEASIRYSRQYQDKVLTFVVTRRQPVDNTKLTFQIDGITPEEWEECKSIFLQFGDYGCYQKYETDCGNILVGDGVRGKLFVSGVLIQSHDDLEYGYDFAPHAVELNHERTMVASWSLTYNTSRMWNEVTQKEASGIRDVEDMLYRDVLDVSQIHESYISGAELRNKLVERFIAKHGENVHPACNGEEMNRLEHVGVKPAMVGKAFGSILKSHPDIGTIEAKIQAMNETPRELVSVMELEEDERLNFSTAFAIVHEAAIMPYTVKVVTFNDEKMRGHCDHANKTIYIARQELKSMQSALTVLVHEHAHWAGGDGQAIFEEAERRLWAKIAVGLYNLISR